MQQVPALLFIPLLPLLGAVLNGLIALWLARREAVAGQPRPAGSGARLVAWIGVLAPLASAVTAWSVALDLFQADPGLRQFHYDAGRWFGVGGWQVDWAFLLDPLSVTMVLVITSIGTLIHLYSVGYMQGDKGFARFFCYLNLFTAAMLVLVLAQDLVVMFVGWEGVGLCSYLLIGYWFEDRLKASAGVKAFVVNRIGDLGFVLGMFVLYWTLRPFGIHSFDVLRIQAAAEVLPYGVVTAATLLMFIGATGKSAQLPLHVWLPDAMAGPTPVSALIHAATMVTAGVYMVTRLSVLFTSSTMVLGIIAGIGALTALYAATVACAQSNVKRVIAWSTVSQLGYMFLGLGTGAYATGVFHLLTHAFFKGLFFLSAGAVIHALHGEEDLAKMGGLAGKLRFTAVVFTIAALANAGFPPFSGFVSKDAIIAAAWQANHGLGAIALLTAGITAFYSMRLVLLVFAGTPRDAHLAEHAHEPPLSMSLPLGMLAVGALGIGALNWPAELGGHELFSHFLEPVLTLPSLPVESGGQAVTWASVAMVLLGFAIAWVRYGVGQPTTGTPLRGTEGLWNFLGQGWKVDELYAAVVVRPLWVVAERVMPPSERVVLGIHDGVALLYRWSGERLRVLQTGLVRTYGYAMFLGVLALALAAVTLGGLGQ